MNEKDHYPHFEATLETECLWLRPFQESDDAELFRCCQNPHLGDNAGWKPHETLEESRAVLFDFFIKQEDTWAIVLKSTNQLIGSIGLIADPKRENAQARMLGYWLDEAYWGKGLMNEAAKSVLNYGLETLKLSLITAHCYPNNQRSKALLRRNGFLYEGTLHEAEICYNGQILDHDCYYLKF